jgi:hypothetical protein
MANLSYNAQANNAWAYEMEQTNIIGICEIATPTIINSGATRRGIPHLLDPTGHSATSILDDIPTALE